MNVSARQRKTLLLGLTMALLASAVTPAVADERWQHHGNWDRGHDRRDWNRGGYGGGDGSGVILGLGLGAVLGATILAPRGYYAPPPPVYYGY